MTDVIVVGCGPAGMAVATATATRGLATVVYDSVAPGGRLLNIDSVDGVRGVDLATDLMGALAASGAELRLEPVSAVEPGPPPAVLAGGRRHPAPVVVLATGWTDGRLDVDGPVNHCASCDGPLFAGQDVVVVGGDDWALDEALVLRRWAASVTVLAPALTGSADRIAAADADERVTVVADATVVGLEGDGRLTAVEVASRGRIAASAAFVYVGSTRREELLPEAFTEPGVPGVYVVGGPTVADALASAAAVVEQIGVPA